MKTLLLALCLCLCSCVTDVELSEDEQALCPELGPGGHRWTDYIDGMGRPVTIYVNYFDEYCTASGGGQGIRTVFWSMIYLRPTYTLLSSKVENFGCNSCGSPF